MSDYFDEFIEAVARNPLAATRKLEFLLRAACTCGNAAADLVCHLTPGDHKELFAVASELQSEAHSDICSKRE